MIVICQWQWNMSEQETWLHKCCLGDVTLTEVCQSRVYESKKNLDWDSLPVSFFKTNTGRWYRFMWYDVKEKVTWWCAQILWKSKKSCDFVSCTFLENLVSKFSCIFRKQKVIPFSLIYWHKNGTIWELLWNVFSYYKKL